MREIAHALVTARWPERHLARLADLLAPATAKDDAVRISTRFWNKALRLR